MPLEHQDGIPEYLARPHLEDGEEMLYNVRPPLYRSSFLTPFTVPTQAIHLSTIQNYAPFTANVYMEGHHPSSYSVWLSRQRA